MSQQVDGLQEAHELAAKVLTPRFRKLDGLKRYFYGTQYEGRPDFFNPGSDVPLLERAPKVVYPIAHTAAHQHMDFALGEGRFPKFSVSTEDDESGLEDEFALPEEDAKKFQAFLVTLSDHMCLQDTAQDALEEAESTGSVGAILMARNGRLEVEPQDARSVTPTLDEDGKTVLKFEIRYPYVDIYKAQDGKYKARCLMYRRVLDDQADTLYKPAVVPPDGSEPSWSVDKKVSHGLGFCPAVWYPFKRRRGRVDSIDGDAIHCTLTDEIDALNFGLSQRYRAALYSGDPQMVEFGVDSDEEVAPTGRHAMPIPDLVDGNGRHYAAYGFGTRPRDTRRKGAGTVWRYSNPDAKAELLTLPGDALDSITDQCNDLEDKISQVLGYTKASPENVRGATSGKALGYLFARTTAFCDRVRRDFWDGFLWPVMSMALRMVAKLGNRLLLPGIKSVSPLLSKFEREIEGGTSIWLPPRVTPVWGEYFPPTAEDEKATVEMAANAYEKKIITRELAIEKLRGIFQFESAELIEEELEEEAEEEQALAQEQATADREAGLGLLNGKPVPKAPASQPPKAKPE